LGLVAGAARADLRRVEAEGAVPVPAGAEPAVAGLRHEAVQAALANAALATGLELAGFPADDPAARTRVGEALGGSATGFVVSYRVLEDRGVEPRRVLEDPAVAQEYAVRIEARVDAGRLRRRLTDAGVLGAAAQPRPLAKLRLVLVDLPSYAVLEQVRTALVQAAGAASALPVEFRRREATLEVATDRPEPELVAALQAALAPGITLEALPEVPDQPLRLRVRSEGAPGPAKASDD
jgi:hypothetical protein